MLTVSSLGASKDITISAGDNVTLCYGGCIVGKTGYQGYQGHQGEAGKSPECWECILSETVPPPITSDPSFAWQSGIAQWNQSEIVSWDNKVGS